MDIMKLPEQAVDHTETLRLLDSRLASRAAHQTARTYVVASDCPLHGGGTVLPRQ